MNKAFFKELDLTEGRATGIPKIYKSIENNGSPLPQITTDTDHTYFLVVIKIHPLSEVPFQYEAQDELSFTEKELSEAISNLSQVCPKSVSSDVIAKIMLLCLKTNLSVKTLMKMTEQTNRTRFRNTYINLLLDLEYLEMTIPDKPRRQKQKYKITQKGKKAIVGRR